MKRKRVLPPTASRALRLYRRLLSLFASRESAFEWLISTAGRLPLAERGERHELWETLRDLEFLLFWPDSGGIAASAGKTEARVETRSGTAIKTTWSGSAEANRQGPLLQGRKAQPPGRSNHLPSWSAVIPTAPFRGRRSAYSLASWPRTVQERHSPARWRNIQWNNSSQLRNIPPEGGWTGLTITPGGYSFFERDVALNTGKTFFAPLARCDRGFRRQEGMSPRLRSTDDAADAMDRPAGRPTAPLPIFMTPAERKTGMPSNEWEVRADTNQEISLNPTWQFLVSQSRGSTLGIFQRVLLEPFFPDMNLADVRIHTDESADRAARSLRAAAFSLGRDIFFRAGRFCASTPKGLALLGHELLHTLQTAGGEPLPAEVNRAGLEHEAGTIESFFLQWFRPGGVPRSEPRASPVRGAGEWYAPLSLEPARTGMTLPNYGRTGSGGKRSISLSALPAGENRSHPLKADESRPAAPGAGSTAPSPSQSDDQEGLTRALFRTLERKIRTEKERRGVDLWER